MPLAPSLLSALALSAGVSGTAFPVSGTGFLVSGPPGSPPVPGTRASAKAPPDPVDRLLADAMARAHVPGAAVAVVRGGKVLKLGVYGKAELEHGVKVTPATAFQIASTTKLLTGVLLARLVEQGKLSLDDPLSKHLDAVPDTWGAVTLRQLATHTSGLPVTEPDPKLGPVPEAARAALAARPAARPGERAEYGSLDYTVLAAVLEKVGGKPFPRLLEEEVLGPAGMRDARFEAARDDGLVRSADVVPGRVTTYRWSGGAQRVAWFLYPEYTWAAGGLFASVRDLAAFVAALQRGALVSRESLARMAEPPTLADGRPGAFGTGCTVGRHRGFRTLGHSGGPALGDVLLFPELDLGVVVLTNQKLLQPELAELVAELYLPADRRQPPGPLLADAAPAATARVRAVLEGMARGAVDPALLAPARREDAPLLSEWGPVGVGLWGPLTSLALVEERRDARGWTRWYRASWFSVLR